MDGNRAAILQTRTLRPQGTSQRAPQGEGHAQAAWLSLLVHPMGTVDAQEE